MREAVLTDGKWGGPKNPPVDAIVLIYATTKAALVEIVEREKKCLREDYGFDIFCDISMEEISDPTKSKEPFGFRDGISQPSFAVHSALIRAPMLSTKGTGRDRTWLQGQHGPLSAELRS